MRVTLAGKGGSGKTTIAAALARLAARRGTDVVAIDADSNPNLGPALGVEPGPEANRHLPVSLVSRRLDGPTLTIPLDELLHAYASPGPEGIRLLSLGGPGHADEGCLCGQYAAVAAVMNEFGARSDTLTVIDMEASPEHMSRGTARHSDVLLLVAEPYFRSLESIARLARLAAELPIPRTAVVANKIRTPQDSGAVADFCARHGIRHLGDIPWGDEVTAADRQARSLIDSAPTGPVMAAVARIAPRLGASALQQ